MVFGFTILIGLTVEAYRQAPPIPARAVAPGGAVIFTKDDVVAGQQVFLKYGLMANGTIWGHGAYLGPIHRAARADGTREIPAPVLPPPRTRHTAPCPVSPKPGENADR